MHCSCAASAMLSTTISNTKEMLQNKESSHTKSNEGPKNLRKRPLRSGV